MLTMFNDRLTNFPNAFTNLENRNDEDLSHRALSLSPPTSANTSADTSHNTSNNSNNNNSSSNNNIKNECEANANEDKKPSLPLCMLPSMMAATASNTALSHLYPPNFNSNANLHTAALTYNMLSPPHWIDTSVLQATAMAWMAAAQMPMQPSAMFHHYLANLGQQTAAAQSSRNVHSPRETAAAAANAAANLVNGTLVKSPLASPSMNNYNNQMPLKHERASPSSGSCSPTASGGAKRSKPARKFRKIDAQQQRRSATTTPTATAAATATATAIMMSPPSSSPSPNTTQETIKEAPSVGSGSGSGSVAAVKLEKQYTCVICQRSFGYKHVLQNHERTHTGEKPFECNICHKRFTRDHHLKTHMRLHTGEKPYHCSHCNRDFVQVANLRRHLRVHTGDKPYTCEICKSSFSDSNQLKAHRQTHAGEHPFQCERCNMRFRRRHHLTQHKCPYKQQPPQQQQSAALLSPTLLSSSKDHDASEEHSLVSASASASDVGSPLYDEPELGSGGGGGYLSASPALPEQMEPEDLSIRARDLTQ